MKKALRGHWLASTITGLLVAVIGSLLSQLFANPGAATTISLALAAVITITVALVLDRIGDSKMQEPKKLDDRIPPRAAFVLEDCENAIVEDNYVQGDIDLLSAKRTKNLRVRRNLKED